MRINVVGTSGSGKSTLSKRLARALMCPYYEMDQFFWLPDWREASDDVFYAAIKAATSQPDWVLDGNYNRTIALKWQQVDTVVWLDYSFSRTLFQALKRAIARSLSGQELWVGTGNKESFKRSLMSRDSILLWTIKTYKSNQARYQAMMLSPEYAHIHFVRLTCPQQTEYFIERISQQKVGD